ncbi:MAG: hypothetical protein HY363_00205 [Candidatus Aenigmarchaeota archaeon]|nr:hypothetical protein [Candidatus Aenigmarchaeota archaeon]
MKKHPEIKWSETARQNIITYAKTLKGSVHGKEILATFSPDEQAEFRKISEEKQKKLFKKLEREEWKHKKFLTPV